MLFIKENYNKTALSAGEGGFAVMLDVASHLSKQRSCRIGSLTEGAPVGDGWRSLCCAKLFFMILNRFEISCYDDISARIEYVCKYYVTESNGSGKLYRIKQLHNVGYLLARHVRRASDRATAADSALYFNRGGEGSHRSGELADTVVNTFGTAVSADRHIIEIYAQMTALGAKCTNYIFHI